jgi:hypothetical protein
VLYGIAVPLNPEQRIEKVDPLARAGLSTREIARLTEIPQSTVVRDIQKINTGPHPIVKPPGRLRERLPFPQLPGRLRLRGVALMAIVLLLLAAGLGILVQRSRPIHTYIRVVEPAAPISMCVGITLQGYLTDLTPATNGKCPAGWKMLVLHPGS